jgi:hypothetical protein
MAIREGRHFRLTMENFEVTLRCDAGAASYTPSRASDAE